jgi:hypothetical protein
MNDYATHARSVKAFQDRLGDACPVIAWARKEYKIIPNTALRRQDLNSGGMQLNADLRFEVLVETFQSDTITDAASLKDALLQTEIGYLGDAYKVEQVGIRPGELHVVVDCNSLYQNA